MPARRSTSAATLTLSSGISPPVSHDPRYIGDVQQRRDSGDRRVGHCSRNYPQVLAVHQVPPARPRIADPDCRLFDSFAARLARACRRRSPGRGAAPALFNSGGHLLADGRLCGPGRAGGHPIACGRVWWGRPWPPPQLRAACQRHADWRPVGGGSLRSAKGSAGLPPQPLLNPSAHWRNARAAGSTVT